MKKTDPVARAPWRQLPAVDRLLDSPVAAVWRQDYGQQETLRAMREVLAETRAALTPDSPVPETDTLLSLMGARLQTRAESSLRTVFNLTGTVLHTNLGRATLPESVIDAIARVCRNPCALEYTLDAGSRGDRDDVVLALLCELTGAEAATVVNNNAAAVFLMLNTLALRRQVVVSRGELVEIGGAFRVPDIMQRAGAKLMEVGCTNRTHAHDYEQAINPRTALLMKVHTSNYAIQGFTHAVPAVDLARIARTHGLPFVEDLGSGTLIGLERWGLPHEPTPREALQAGANLVSFSGDKLLGGPQAGILVGDRVLIDQLKKNPLKRALRLGKLTLAALEAVLRLYRDPDSLPEKLETLRLLTRPSVDIEAQGRRLLPVLQQALTPFQVRVTLEPCLSQIGSGSLPVERLPSLALVVRTAGKRGSGLNRVERFLRERPCPVLGRLSEQALWLDLRCLRVTDESAFCTQLCTEKMIDCID
ncbi:MAG TPA: L-seryl-tRNA(Sec) selenium transferase [Thiolinea sp.]|nr:L-seryl-tRNA(Sec) selenium transferase [Thiolinea sp.]